jgi:hypothetical protein
MTILIVIKLFLYLTAFGPMAVLFASVIGLAGRLLVMCVRAIAWLRPRNSADVPRPYLEPHLLTDNTLKQQA